MAVLALAAMLVVGCGGGGGSGKAAEANPPPGGSNGAPTVQGTPASSVLVGQAYSFQPSISDPNGDPLTITGQNVPSWATFDAQTGRISGTPSSVDVGTYSNITIRASDGTATTTFGPFAITVTAAASGAATLSWTPPTLNSDGSALTNLDGYEIVYGRSSSSLDQTISLTNPSLSTYVVDNLTSGTWFFAVMSRNSNGTMSPLSNIASKTIS
jgi:Putative Ig domain